MSKTSRGGKRNRWRKLTPAEKAACKIGTVRSQVDDLASQLLPKTVLGWDRRQSLYPPGFYTYQLVDPRMDAVFYVGKGQRSRAWQHERNVRAGQPDGNAQKCTRIREIVRLGYEVRVEIVGIYLYEADALEHEFRLIDANPGLTNVASGWLDAGSSAVALEQRRLRREIKLAEARERDRQAAVIAKRDKQKVKFSSMLGAEAHAEAINSWVDGFGARGRAVPI